ncbi:peptide deformylase [Aerococcaceae bacterium zg-ZUI334]|uniref:peptide deformylase n=1 Tax=Aerococcaceae bacterium zg-252 TaxID=2796928 RepID=UPI001B92E6B1|nr:peptide deformylase [Aerococcaceae bacterium zg-ZUI334]MBS4462444.1 peptide deformylase [Aerococcaceae bacterium zg-B36]
MLTMKDIIEEGHPTLRQVAEPVEFPLSDELKETARLMHEFLVNSQDDEIAEQYGLRAGVGLAAPQINLSKQIFAVHLLEYDEDGNEVGVLLSDVIFNPKITRHSVQKVALRDGEGCLSVNRDVPGYVPRPKRITLSYQDINGEHHELRLRDYEAIVVQHELDHLKGIFFYDHINEQNPFEKGDDLQLL